MSDIIGEEKILNFCACTLTPGTLCPGRVPLFPPNNRRNQHNDDPDVSQVPHDVGFLDTHSSKDRRERERERERERKREREREREREKHTTTFSPFSFFFRVAAC